MSTHITTTLTVALAMFLGVAEIPAARDNCCAKRAYCCAQRLPCCRGGAREAAPQATAEARANCCVKRAFCCAVRASCCRALTPNTGA